MGLMPVKGQAPAQPMPQEGAAKDPARYTDESDGNVSPEEQAQYDRAIENAAQLMFDVKTNDFRPGIVEALQATDTPPQEGAEQGQSQPPKILALANAAVMIVSKLDDSAREAGDPLADSVLVEIGTDVVGMLAEQAEAQGVMEYSQDELDGAFITAADMYRAKAVADGRTDEDTLKGQWDELITADQEGRLGEVLPGAEQAAPAEEAPAQEA